MPQGELRESCNRSTYSAWLTKVKGDGARAKWLQSTCRRYFTIDFESNIFYYSHSVTDKRISHPVLFPEIRGAFMESTMIQPGDHHSGNKAPVQRRSDVKILNAIAINRGNMGNSEPAAPTKTTSGWSRQSNSGAFIVDTRDRRIRLVAESESDAFNWIDMLNEAHRIGKGEGREAVGGYAQPADHASTSDMDSLTPQATSPRSLTTSPVSEPFSYTTTASTVSGYSTLEGSTQSTRADSPTSPANWSESDVATPISSAALAAMAQAAQASAAAIQVAAAETPPASSPGAAPKPFLASPTVTVDRDMADERQPTWQAATSAAQANGLSSSGRLQLADFGFDDGEQSEQGSCTRASSPDSVTISPRLHAGEHGREAPRLEHAALLCEQGMHKPSAGKMDAEAVSVPHDDDDSDDEVLCEVRDRRIELDLDLVKTKEQTRKVARAPAASQPLTSTDPTTNVEGDVDAARIAADLGLLRKPGRACSGALEATPAPLRQRLREDGETAVDEDKARRRAERKATKEATKEVADGEEAIDVEKAQRRAARKAAKELKAQEPVASEETLDEDKARRRAARKAAKDAAARELETQEAAGCEEVVDEEKTRRRAARKAAKEAARNMDAAMGAVTSTEQPVTEKIFGLQLVEALEARN